jgi:superkiller protein 3
LAKYDGAISIDPQYKDALYRKGVSFIATNNTTQAVALFDQVLEIDPSYKQAYNAKGLALEIGGAYAESLAAYDKALELDPKFTQALDNKMHTLIAMGKQNDAMKIFWAFEPESSSFLLKMQENWERSKFKL